LPQLVSPLEPKEAGDRSEDNGNNDRRRPSRQNQREQQEKEGGKRPHRGKANYGSSAEQSCSRSGLLSLSRQLCLGQLHLFVDKRLALSPSVTM
jgi:hypothetical protein